MKSLRSIVAHVDFEYSGSLAELASLLSAELFAGIAFAGENTGIWDEVPAVRLSRRFLGWSVELGGQDGHFTVQIEAPDFPWSLVPTDQQHAATVDVSEYVTHLLRKLPQIRI